MTTHGLRPSGGTSGNHRPPRIGYCCSSRQIVRASSALEDLRMACSQQNRASVSYRTLTMLPQADSSNAAKPISSTPDPHPTLPVVRLLAECAYGIASPAKIGADETASLTARRPDYAAEGAARRRNASFLVARTAENPAAAGQYPRRRNIAFNGAASTWQSDPSSASLPGTPSGSRAPHPFVNMTQPPASKAASRIVAFVASYEFKS